MKVKNLILDLGGVLYDLDYTATEKAFQDLGLPFAFSRIQQDSIIDLFEEGKVSSKTFVQHFIEKEIESSFAEEQVLGAWNRMLLQMKSDKIDLLRNLAGKYRLFLYSNTNEIHIRAVYNHLQEVHGYEDFSTFFEQVYLSNELGIRKPKKEGFEYIVQANQLNPKETLFIDDSPQHVQGALAAGIYAEWLNLEIEDIFGLLKRLSL